MKKVSVLLILTLMSWGGMAQDFPGKYVGLLVDKQLKVKEKDAAKQDFGYVGFYADKDLKKVYKAKNGGYSTPYYVLVGKVLKVKSITPYKNSVGLEKEKLELYSSELGKIWFDYDPKDENIFPFKVLGGFKLPADFYCDQVEKEFDKFTKATEYNTPYVDGLSVVASKKDGNPMEYFLSLEVMGNSLNVDKKGVIILLENQRKISLPDVNLKVDIAGNNQYKYSAFITLSREHLGLLRMHNITDIRLYVYDRAIERGYKIKEYIRCIEKAARNSSGGTGSSGRSSSRRSY